MKFNRIFWGIMLVLAALFIIAGQLGYEFLLIEQIPIGRLLVGVLLLYLGFYGIFKKRLSYIIASIAAMFILFEKYIARAINHPSDNIISNWYVFLVALLFYIGLKLLFQPKKTIKKKIQDSTVFDFGDNNDNKISFGGKSTKYIDCVNFESINIENNIGRMDVYFSNIEHYKGNGVIRIENNVGRFNVYVPSSWCATCEVENNIGSAKEPRCTNPNGKLIKVIAENNVGKINIEYVEADEYADTDEE